MLFDFLFNRHKAKRQQPTAYASSAEFVSKNIADLKHLLNFTGYNDPNKNIESLAKIAHCRLIVLCLPADGHNNYTVVKSSNVNICKCGSSIAWQHIQPWASSDYQSLAPQLPFADSECTEILSVPVKGEHNILSGIIIAISTDKSTDVNVKLQMLHLLTPPFEAELRCVRQKHEIRQLEQRIASLNQNIEILNTDLEKERNIATESKNLKSAFLTNLSHEIRTPMNAVVGFMDLVESAQNDQDRHDFITIMKQNCRQLLRVIDSLIDISQLQSNYLLKPPCPTQLNELLTKTKQKYEDLIRHANKDIVIETSFALDTPNDTIWNSDEIIDKVMDLLMDNAFKFTERGKISISYSINHKEATFCVTDTGPGVKPGSEGKIFELFDEHEKIGEDGEQHGKGTGLAIASRYLSLAGGRIWLDTSYRGGACFYFSIPADKL